MGKRNEKCDITPHCALERPRAPPRGAAALSVRVPRRLHLLRPVHATPVLHTPTPDHLTWETALRHALPAGRARAVPRPPAMLHAPHGRSGPHVLASVASRRRISPTHLPVHL
jgi:hypothetical protein